MRKLLNIVISLENTFLSLFGKNHQGAIDNRITLALNSWIKDGRYTRSDVNMDDIALELGVEKAQLQYYFKNVMGVSFSAWRKKLRINEAKRIMNENPDMPASAVGAAVGYPDKSNFRKRFYEVESCTPNEWKSMR